MIRLILQVVVFLVSFCLFTSLAKAQNESSIVDVKIKSCRIKFSLENKSSTNLEIPNVCVSYSKGKYVPKYYSVLNDTLEVKLLGGKNLIQTGHSLRDSVVVKGKRMNTNLEVKPDEKITFSIPSNRKDEINVIKVLLKNQRVLYYPKAP